MAYIVVNTHALLTATPPCTAPHRVPRRNIPQRTANTPLLPHCRNGCGTRQVDLAMGRPARSGNQVGLVWRTISGLKMFKNFDIKIDGNLQISGTENLKTQPCFWLRVSSPRGVTECAAQNAETYCGRRVLRTHLCS